MPSEERMKLMADQVAEIHTILTGGKDPQKGLVYKVARVEDHVTFVRRIGWIIVTVALGVLTKGFLMLIATLQQSIPPK